MPRSAFFLLLLSASLPAQTGPVVLKETAPTSSQPRSVTLSLQSGFAETFQLTLGGMFGAGPAWQNRVTFTLNNATSPADAIVLTGWQTHDTPTHANDWLAGIAYRRKVVNRRQNALTLTGGFQKWRFPSVKSGANDWLAAYNALYQTRLGAVPITVSSDAWTILYSPLPGGSLINTQASAIHPLVKSDKWSLSLKHGPSHTYSWNFYGTQGHRVLRYSAGLVASTRATVVEAGYRKQWALQPRIPENNFWSVCVTHSFNFKL
jgi:predicted secreted protein